MSKKKQYHLRLLRGEDKAYDTFRMKGFEALLELRKIQVQHAETEIRYWREGPWGEETKEIFESLRQQRIQGNLEVNRFEKLARQRAELVLAERKAAKEAQSQADHSTEPKD